MSNETGVQNSSIHSLIPLGDFKAILGIDDREDCLYFAPMRNTGTLFQPPSLAAFCLITATYTIEQYCKRRLVRRKNTDYLTFTGEYIFSLREYPVRKILAVYAAKAGTVIQAETLLSPENLVESKHYYCLPDEGIWEGSDLWSAPFSLVLRPPMRLSREEQAIKVRYLAGYSTRKAGDPGGVPTDLASACLELAAWNMARYRGRRIGMTGAVRGSGRDGEHLESSLPENVRQLLEPYRRRML